jgi:hypothetical protein
MALERAELTYTIGEESEENVTGEYGESTNTTGK